MNWSDFLWSDLPVTPEIVQAATLYDTCPMGQVHRQYVRQIDAATWDATPDCPPKLRKLATQFMDAAEEGDVERMREVHDRILEWRAA